MPLSTGQILNGRYRNVRLLGQGGFGAVYQVWDIHLNKHWALKENLDTSQEAERQFTREATILATLSHPNLPRVTDHFSIPGQGHYLVMDFIEGEDLESILKRQGRVPTDQAITWIAQVADALVYLHSQLQPVIHRDLKPGNIRITPAGRAMLVDFGLAKVYDPHLRTTVGARAVTPGYSPPEQYGMGNTDIRSDIYALGATLYTLLTGLEPQESVQRFADDQLIPASSVNPQVPAHIGQAIAHAMDLKPSQRYQMVFDFKQAITAPKPLPTPPPPPSPPPPPPPQPSTTRKPWIIPLGVAAGIGLLALAFVVIPRIIGPTATATPPPAVPGGTTSTDTPVVVTPPGGAGTIVTPSTDTAPSIVTPPTDTPSPTYTPTPSDTPAPAGSSDGMVLLYIPKGNFRMGDSAEHAQSECERVSTMCRPNVDIAFTDEAPAHPVYLDAYWIDRTEVSNAEYILCVQAGSCTSNGAASNNFPAANVSWFDASKYCAWAGRRLPTEAEWEKAARGTDGGTFPWGSSAPSCSLANYFGCGGNVVTVDSNQDGASPFGALNMAGNVSEWVEDWFKPGYGSDSAQPNPKGPHGPLTYRSRRGGSYSNPEGFLRVTGRSYFNPNDKLPSIGFRCAANP